MKSKEAVPQKEIKTSRESQTHQISPSQLFQATYIRRTHMQLTIKTTKEKRGK